MEINSLIFVVSLSSLHVAIEFFFFFLSAEETQSLIWSCTCKYLTLLRIYVASIDKDSSILWK